jgi:hypothetical protein
MKVLSGLGTGALPAEVLNSTEPLLLRGLAGHWPAVQAAQRSPALAAKYLHEHWRGAPVQVFLGMPEIEGRFSYNEDCSGFNFGRASGGLGVLQTLMQVAGDPGAPAMYVGATDIEACLPGFRAANDLPLAALTPLVSIWLGNRSRVAAHYDLPNNIACVVAGRRRFTLFPPEEVGNLYIGPLEPTPAGQAISLVDFKRPDLQRFPRFAQAMQRAQVAELGPGDAVFIPSMWWHHVEALDDFNVLVNYWWRAVGATPATPTDALTLALLTLRDLPPAQREAWRALFAHYVFDAGAATAAHIPAPARHALAPLDSAQAQALLAQLLERLKR